MKIKCRFCGSGNVRTSHLRLRKDWRMLLRRMLPVRCHACNHRDYLEMKVVRDMRHGHRSQEG